MNIPDEILLFKGKKGGEIMDSEEDVVDMSLKRKRYLRMLVKERKRKKEIRDELILRKRWLLQCVEEDKKKR